MKFQHTKPKMSLILFVVIFLFSCTSSDEKELRRTYTILADAVINNNTVLIAKIAPFLAQEENQQALYQLQLICTASPSVTVKYINAHQAVLHLSNPGNIMLPFIRDTAGNWILSSTLQHTQIIDFIPSSQE